jgi:hypothetical protein
MCDSARALPVNSVEADAPPNQLRRLRLLCHTASIGRELYFIQSGQLDWRRP